MKKASKNRIAEAFHPSRKIDTGVASKSGWNPRKRTDHSIMLQRRLQIESEIRTPVHEFCFFFFFFFSLSRKYYSRCLVSQFRYG